MAHRNLDLCETPYTLPGTPDWSPQKRYDAMHGATRVQIDIPDKLGFIALVDVMPRLVPEGLRPEYAILQAARVSYGHGTKHVSDDAVLLRYLLRHRHTSPSEMMEVKFHVRLPIFVARQWIRHRTANVNEMSARYSEVPGGDDAYWVPSEWRKQGTGNKQGGEEPMKYTPANFAEFPYEASAEDNSVYEYQRRIKAGVSREMARSCLPVSIYTEWYWKCDMRNILHFLSLRRDSHAQREIRLFADAMHDLILPLAPVTLQAWKEYEFEAMRLTSREVAALKQILQAGKWGETGSTDCFENKREQQEFMDKLKKLGVL